MNATDVLIVCPPSAPPPLAPPGFDQWAAQIPFWFWFVIVMSFVTSAMTFVVGCVFVFRMWKASHERLPVGDVLRELNARMKANGRC